MIEFVQAELDKRLLGANSSRVFFTQTLLPGATAPEGEDKADAAADAPDLSLAGKKFTPAPSKQVLPSRERQPTTLEP